MKLKTDFLRFQCHCSTYATFNIIKVIVYSQLSSLFPEESQRMMVFADIWKFFNIREMCKIKIKSKITVYANSLCKNVENSLKHIFLAYIAYIAI